MDLLLLGGNSPKNKDWIEQVSLKLAPLFSHTKVQYYNHWQEENKSANFAAEFATMVQNAKDLGENYCIFAKSFGTALTLKGIQDGVIAPQKCILTGCAFGEAKAPLLLKGLKIPTLFIQQTSDPYLAFEDLKILIEDNDVLNYELKEVKGRDHKYSDIDELYKLIEVFI